jgi:hypothetical protein
MELILEHWYLAKLLNTKVVKKFKIAEVTETSILLYYSEFDEQWMHKVDFYHDYTILEDLGIKEEVNEDFEDDENFDEL